MTDDLVERLRCTPSALAAEAAAEIARVRIVEIAPRKRKGMVG